MFTRRCCVRRCARFTTSVVVWQKRWHTPGAAWADETACHAGANQDKQCRLYGSSTPATERDLSGGWHDAGDYNKYVNFALNPVLDLARCYLEQPDVFGDDAGIPESGNGIPDLLDELKWGTGLAVENAGA
jgi:endoglucanase